MSRQEIDMALHFLEAIGHVEKCASEFSRQSAELTEMGHRELSRRYSDRAVGAWAAYYALIDAWRREARSVS